MIGQFSVPYSTVKLFLREHDKTTQVVKKKKTLINDLTFRMPQNTSTEVTVGYLTNKKGLSRALHRDKTRRAFENAAENTSRILHFSSVLK